MLTLRIPPFGVANFFSTCLPIHFCNTIYFYKNKNIIIIITVK